MKKSLLIVLMTALLPHFAYSATETPLLLEVKKALEVPSLDEKEMAQNSYVYLLTIDAKDDDYFDMAKKYLIVNNQWLKQVVKDYDKDKLPSPPKLTYDSILDMKIDGKDYVFPCNRFTPPIDPTCIANILSSKQQAIALINKNQKVLTRFEQVISLPNFHTYNELFYSNYPEFAFLSNLELLQAVYAIDEGDINKGLDILEQQIGFDKKALLSKDRLTKVVMRSRLIEEYRIISGLLNAYPDLTKEPHLTKVRSLLRPLPNYNFNQKDIMLDLRFNAFISTIIEKKNYKQTADKLHLTYNLNKTLNKIYFSFEPSIKFTQLTLPEIRKIYLNNESIGPLNECSIEDGQIISGDCDKDNQYGDFMASAGNSLKYYFYALYDADNYLALVNLQLDILAKGIKEEQVPAFLASAGDKAVNIITQKPFVWNRENSTISTNFLTIMDKIRNPIAIKIKFNQ